MTLDDLKTQMLELGYRWQPFDNDSTKIGLFYKRIQTKRPCVCNDKDQLTVEVFDHEMVPDSLRPSALPRFSLTAGITGEFPLPKFGRWARLQVYNLTPAEFFESHVEVEAALVRAWEALA